MPLKPFFAILILYTLTLSSPAMAWESDNTLGPNATPTGIAYYSGGIGDSDPETIVSLGKDYNVRLTFAIERSGGYVADVKVTVENTKTHEKVLDVISGGPFFFAKLPDGNYKITAELDGAQQTKSVTLRKGLPRGAVFYFKHP